MNTVKQSQWEGSSLRKWPLVERLVREGLALRQGKGRSDHDLSSELCRLGQQPHAGRRACECKHVYSRVNLSSSESSPFICPSAILFSKMHLDLNEKQNSTVSNCP